MKNGTLLDVLLQSLTNAPPQKLDGLASGLLRTLSVDELTHVSGGIRPVEPTTHSGGAADDCGSP